MMSSCLQLLFNAADVIVVSRFAGNSSLAAVGSTTTIINLLTNLFIGFSIGANVNVARTIDICASLALPHSPRNGHWVYGSPPIAGTSRQMWSSC